MTAATSYQAPAWLPGGHLQTVWPLLIRAVAPPYRRERLDTPDGDFVDLDWLPGASHGTPLVVLFHGLEGSSQSHYAVALMQALAARAWGGVVVHFRGCSGEPNRLLRAYHSGDSAEIHWLLHHLRQQTGGPLLAMGVSLGANALLKWLGEQGTAAGGILRAAAGICAPMDLAAANEMLSRGLSRLYARHFLVTLIPAALDKLRRHPGAFDGEQLKAARTLRDFDDIVTAPIHGFADAADYYARASAGPFLGRIGIPTLVMNPRNDPFLPPWALPAPQQLPPSVRLETPAGGGHVGFVSGDFPGHLQWLPERVLSFFDEAMR